MANLDLYYELKDKAYELGDFETVAHYDQLINNAEKAQRVLTKGDDRKEDYFYHCSNDENNYYLED